MAVKVFSTRLIQTFQVMLKKNMRNTLAVLMAAVLTLKIGVRFNVRETVSSVKNTNTKKVRKDTAIRTLVEKVSPL